MKHTIQPPTTDKHLIRWVETGPPAFTSAPQWVRRRRLPPEARWARSVAIRWPCCHSADTTWATTFVTGLKMQRKLSITPRVFHVNWFRKIPTASFCGRATAKICACSSGSSIAYMAVFGVRRHQSAGRRISTTWSGRAWTSPGGRSTRFRRSTARRGSGEVRDQEELFIALHDHLPSELVYERELLICRL
jgi:hypothetical protein